MKRFLILGFSLFLSKILLSQHSEDEKYVPETDSLALINIQQWQGLKFGLLMHWGPYSQWGIVESWSICPEEYGWCERKMGTNPGNYMAYKKEYENLPSTFNPVRFNPEKWAIAAKEAGMRYVVFTTKHHDGFSMFDSKYTDYKITGPACAFSTHPKSNITLEIFNAFRKQGLWTGAYFSKPDWHHPNYWDTAYPPRDRNVNYEPESNPDKWSNYVNFTHNQVLELLKDYGKVNILWLDGGWVSKKSKDEIKSWYDEQFKESKTGYVMHRNINQDILMDDLVAKARTLQPGLIVVDRAVYGKNQNYLTPENRVPAKALPYPWESCIISGGGWAHTPNATYMTGREGIHLLVDIVSKGGNLLLNIAPSPEGEWQDGAYQLLKEYAAWMKVNQQAIYQTHALAPFKEKQVCFTQDSTGRTNFIYLQDKNESKIPEQIQVFSHCPKAGSTVTLLGSNQKLTWKKSGEGCVIYLPKSLRKAMPCQYAWVFSVDEIERK